MIGHARGEQTLVRVAIGPRALIPAIAQNPRALGCGGRARDNAVHRLGLGGHTGEIHAVERLPEFSDVRVRVNEPREQHVTGKVHGARVGPHERQRAGVAAHEDDATVAHRHRRGVVPPAFHRVVRRVRRRPSFDRRFRPRHRVHVPIVQNEIRRGRICLPA